MAYTDNTSGGAPSLTGSLGTQETIESSSGQSMDVSTINTSTASLAGFFPSSVPATINSLDTRSIGAEVGPRGLHPRSFAELRGFTSLDGSSILSISNREYYKGDCDIPNTLDSRPIFALEKHITVIKKGPTMPLQLEMYPYEDATVDMDRAEVSDYNVGANSGSYVGDDAIINSSLSIFIKYIN